MIDGDKVSRERERETTKLEISNYCTSNACSYVSSSRSAASSMSSIYLGTREVQMKPWKMLIIQSDIFFPHSGNATICLTNRRRNVLHK